MPVLRRSGPPPHPARQPITLQQLRTLKERLFATRTLNLIDQEMIWAALTLAYFGLLRVSEYVSCNAHTFNVDQTLTRRMVNIQPRLLHISLRASKHDQLGQGAQLSIGATGTDICPVEAMRRYLVRKTWPNAETPLFCFSLRQYLTAADINFWLCHLLGQTVTIHCLRIGGTTWAAEAGVHIWQSQAGGRWRSNAYKRYIRPSPAALSGLTVLITHEPDNQ